jgi:hypothetical protein
MLGRWYDSNLFDHSNKIHSIIIIKILEKLQSGYETSNKMSPISQGTPVSIGRYTPGMSPYVVPNAESVSPTKLADQIKQKIHSRKFRE